MTRLSRSGLVRAAGGALAITAAMLVWTAWRAARIDAVPASGAPAADQGSAPKPEPRPTYPADRVLAAVARDPFHPERRRPGRRFELPGNAAARVVRPRPPGHAAAAVRLIGVAVDAGGGGGGSAICQTSGSAARLVRVGERVGEWTLKRVLPGAAEFQTPAGRTVTLRVPKAGT